MVPDKKCICKCFEFDIKTRRYERDRGKERWRKRDGENSIYERARETERERLHMSKKGERGEKGRLSKTEKDPDSTCK